MPKIMSNLNSAADIYRKVEILDALLCNQPFRINKVANFILRESVNVVSIASKHLKRCNISDKGKIRSEIERQADIYQSRFNNRLIIIGGDLAYQLKESVLKKESERLRKVWPYRMGSSSWAGGENDFQCCFLDCKNSYPHIHVSKSQVWSRNGKWSGNNYSFSLYYRPSQVWSLIDNKITVIARTDIDKDNITCFWWEQGRGCNLNFNEGLIRSGKHRHAGSLIQPKSGHTIEIEKEMQHA